MIKNFRYYLFYIKVKLMNYIHFIQWKFPHCHHICLWCRFRWRCMNEFVFEVYRAKYWDK